MPLYEPRAMIYRASLVIGDLTTPYRYRRTARYLSDVEKLVDKEVIGRLRHNKINHRFHGGINFTFSSTVRRYVYLRAFI